jgi:DNA-binding transcriptional ArsR family regulator
LSATLGARADPTPRANLARLAVGGATVYDLAKPFAMSLPAVSRHLKVLQRAGLVTQGREAQWRPCRLDAEPLKEVLAWVEQYRRHWEGRLDRLDRFLREQPSSAHPDGYLDG